MRRSFQFLSFLGPAPSIIIAFSFDTIAVAVVVRVRIDAVFLAIRLFRGIAPETVFHCDLAPSVHFLGEFVSASDEVLVKSSVVSSEDVFWFRSAR